MEDIFVRLKDLPYGMNAVTILDEERDYKETIMRDCPMMVSYRRSAMKWCISKEMIFIMAFQLKKQKIYSNVKFY